MLSDPGFVLLVAVVLFLWGMVAGKWLTDARWRGNAKQVYRLSSGRRLFKVVDVTPWDEATKKDRDHWEDHLG